MAAGRASADSELFQASYRYARISARKARLVIDLVRGEPVEAALTKLRFCQRRAASMIRKLVESAIANATQKSGAEPEDLVVHRAYVDEGPTLKRWRPRSMGRAYPRLKRTSHISVVLRQVEKAKEPSRSRGGRKGGARDAGGEPGEAATAKQAGGASGDAGGSQE
jgi:large subunit ribosomal protein L22